MCIITLTESSLLVPLPTGNDINVHILTKHQNGSNNGYTCQQLLFCLDIGYSIYDVRNHSSKYVETVVYHPRDEI